MSVDAIIKARDSEQAEARHCIKVMSKNMVSTAEQIIRGLKLSGNFSDILRLSQLCDLYLQVEKKNQIKACDLKVDLSSLTPLTIPRTDAAPLPLGRVRRFFLYCKKRLRFLIWSA